MWVAEEVGELGYVEMGSTGLSAEQSEPTTSVIVRM